MSTKIIISPITEGWGENVLPFNLSNDSFPVLNNAYTWRGRVKRKRGTISLARLQKFISLSATPKPWELLQFALVAGGGNLKDSISPPLDAQSSITRSSISIVIGANTYTDPNLDGTLTGAPSGSGTINYTTGAFTISGATTEFVTGTYACYPSLPVMGLRQFSIPTSTVDRLLAFDTRRSYQIVSNSTNFYNTNFYKSPVSIDTNNPVFWSALDSDQFWTTNYQGSLWATNGTPGFHFLAANVTGVNVVSPTELQFVVVNPSVVADDYIFVNEIVETVVVGDLFLNGLSGKVLSATAATINLEVPSGTYNVYVSGGVVQLLTRSVTGDGIRWYDGDPTGADGIPNGSGKGWVNFAPPLFSNAIVSIDDVPKQKYYLVGAKLILQFKDRLVFFGVYIQNFGAGAPIYLQDTVVFSWNGTAYYASPVPTNQTFDPTAYVINVSGKGGWIAAGIDQPITTVEPDQDVLIIGFPSNQTRLVYTSNDLFPFIFYGIDEELGNDATFSSVHTQKGVYAYGRNGFTITSQNQTQRIDLQIPNRAFRLKGTSGDANAKRISSIRDFFNEWIDFTFSPSGSLCDFPTKTFKYNYRENSWSYHDENFTAQGHYRRREGYTWATLPYETWAVWNVPWLSSQNISLFLSVIAGTPQGFVVIKGDTTSEAPTGAISAVADNGTGFYRITSKDHCVERGQYLYFTSFIGETFLNEKIGQVSEYIDADTFVIDIEVPDPFLPNDYLGCGVFTRLIIPFIQTKQFAIYWEQGRKVRLGSQKYLLDKTSTGQISVYIYLSQDIGNAWSRTVILPDDESTNDGLVYSSLVYTCPESTNIGLTAANTNLQMPTASSQEQIWHRQNTSLIGDTFQVAFTLNDAQMRNLSFATNEVSLSSMEFDVSPGPMLA